MYNCQAYDYHARRVIPQVYWESTFLGYCINRCISGDHIASSHVSTAASTVIILRHHMYVKGLCTTPTMHDALIRWGSCTIPLVCHPLHHKG